VTLLTQSKSCRRERKARRIETRSQEGRHFGDGLFAALFDGYSVRLSPYDVIKLYLSEIYVLR
jgi:hypothetical protein